MKGTAEIHPTIDRGILSAGERPGDTGVHRHLRRRGPVADHDPLRTRPTPTGSRYHHAPPRRRSPGAPPRHALGAATAP